MYNVAQKHSSPRLWRVFLWWDDHAYRSASPWYCAWTGHISWIMPSKGLVRSPVSNVNPNSCSWILTYHSHPGKFGRYAPSLTMAGHYPWGHKTWKQSRKIAAVDPEKKHTISRAAYLLTVSHMPSAGQMLARSSAHPHYHTRTRGNHGKHNHHVFRKRVRHQYCGAHAATIVTVTISHRQSNKDMPVQPRLKNRVQTN